MKITVDSERFDELQMHVLEQLITCVTNGLRKAGVTDDAILFEATGELAFSVAAIFDGSAVMELDGDPVVPVLTFAKERGGEDLISAGGGSWMHEYVFGTVDDMFEFGDDD